MYILSFEKYNTIASNISNTDNQWSVGAVLGAMDYETVTLQEIGHLLGLGHSSVQGAIMWPSINKFRSDFS